MGTVNRLVYHKTRFSENGESLVYSQIDRGEWSHFIDSGNGREPSRVGPVYASKAELLADLFRYATDYGFGR